MAQLSFTRYKYFNNYAKNLFYLDLPQIDLDFLENLQFFKRSIICCMNVPSHK